VDGLEARLVALQALTWHYIFMTALVLLGKPATNTPAWEAEALVKQPSQTSGYRPKSICVLTLLATSFGLFEGV
jgi:hypothetical protein